MAAVVGVNDFFMMFILENGNFDNCNFDNLKLIVFK